MGGKEPFNNGLMLALERALASKPSAIPARDSSGSADIELSPPTFSPHSGPGREYPHKSLIQPGVEYQCGMNAWKSRGSHGV